MPGAGLGCALKGGAVDRDEPKCRGVAVGPLEVIDERPVEVPANVDPVIDGPVQGLERAVDVGNPAGVVGSSDAVLASSPSAARSRFNASPFDAKPLAGESQLRRQRHVLRPEPVAIQSVAARLGENGQIHVLDLPVVTCHVVVVVLVG